jgi:glycosyltransferase involved in cell wall biosynthesis
LHASDCLLLHKKDVGREEIVVSSVIHMCLGSLTPIVTTATRYVEMLEDEVIKYTNLHELRDKLMRIFSNSDFVGRTIKAAERRVRENSAEKIAEEYERLFDSLLAG